MKASCTAFVLALALATPASHAVVMVSGDVQLLASPPASVVEGAFEDDSITRLFLESSVTLAGQITGNLAGLGTIAAGTAVESFFFHFDPVTESPPQTSSGTVTFDGPILAVFTQFASLTSTDLLFGASGTLYPGTNASRGLEPPGGPTGDTVVLLDPMTLSFLFNATTGVDQLRVLVASVPEPGSLALIALAIAGLGLRRRRR